MSGLGATALDGPTMADGAIEYDGSKVYKDSKLANTLFCREAARRWPKLRVRSFSPGFIPSSGLFREPRKDNFLGAQAFTIFAGLAGFAVPIDVGGRRLAHMATASDAEVPPGSYLCGPTGSKGFTREDGFDDGRISKEASDDAKATRLWELSSEIVGC
jgi:protochlorophyllide reductase